MLIPFILEKALNLYADREAVVCGDNRFTYREFAERVTGLSNFLYSQGLRKGECVAILHQNSHEFLETYFAVARLGAILNPLNFRLSPKEIASILEDSGAKVLISASRFSGAVKELESLSTGIQKVIWTGKDNKQDAFDSFNYEEILSHKADGLPPAPDMPDDEVAHLYYTSGTTGRPKGVMLSHKNVCTHALAAIAELHLTDKDHWIHAAPLFHLADAWATFAITWVGGKHVIVPDFNPPEVLGLMEKRRDNHHKHDPHHA